MSRPLDPLLRPRSVAVVGASPRETSLGGMVLRRLVDGGFRGTIYPVNPRQEQIHGLRCWPSLDAIDGEIDLAVIVVPRDAVLDAADACCARRVGAAAVITAGFREAGEEGAALEAELTRRLRGCGIRFIGPNCMGLFNTHPDVGLDVTFSPTPPLRGPLAFASQSGALGVVVLNIAWDRRLGFSQFVSLGNKADLTENDLLDAWADDPDVPVILLYLESFADAPGFLARAREVTRRKPVVLLKAGRTGAGARAASSHTGALAVADTGTDALCAQAGVHRVDTVDELLDVGSVLAACPPLRGPRLAVLTNAGGPGIMAVDEACRAGLEIAELSDATRQALAGRLPPQASTANPVDILPSGSPDDYAFCVERLADDDGVDAVLTITVTPPLFDPLDTLRAIARAATGDTPVVSVFMVRGEFFLEAGSIDGAPPLFRTPEPAVRALAHALRDAAVRAAPRLPPADPALDEPRIADVLQRAVAAERSWLDAGDAMRVLEAAGLSIAPWAECDDDDEAVIAAARAVGWPVALKAAGPGLVHKSDAGGVRLGLADEDAVRDALGAMRARLADAGHAGAASRWFVQRMLAGGREVIVGAHRDPQFGPLVMFGLGGRYVEVFRDVAFRMASSMTEADAEAMIRSLRGLPLLTGTRGEPGVDLAPAREALVRVAALMRRFPAIAELDANPLLLFAEPERAAVVDARVRVDAERAQHEPAAGG
ncbi:MAG: hypothetical protein D6738_15655 [Acidobacteria bacterium]|nr:MAG: hypothetical protein D6738_15655 [Acidobacteriota bacterium]